MRRRRLSTVALFVFATFSVIFILAAAMHALRFIAQAGATDVEAGHVFSGVETMTFQNGFSPTLEYAGIVLVGISSDSTGVTKGNMSWPGDSLVYVGDVGDAAGQDRILVSIDLSALPDSAVVIDATIYLLKTASSVPIAEHPQVGVHRLFRPFEETASWLKRKLTPADTLWVPAGAMAGSAGAQWPSLYGAANYTVRSPRIEINTTATTMPTYAGVKIACGSDSLWYGYSQSVQGDALLSADAIAQARWTVGQSITECWVPIDITHLVTMWHQGFWANYGAIVSYDTANSSMYDVEFHGNLPAGRLRPWVVVHYMLCTW